MAYDSRLSPQAREAFQKEANIQQAADPYEYGKDHVNLTFGDGERPGILGTGGYSYNFDRANVDAGQVPGYQGFQQAVQDAISATDRRRNIEMDTRNADAVRARQMGLADAYAQSAYGFGGPSLAALQGQRSQQNNLMSALKGMGSTRRTPGAYGELQGALGQANLQSNAQAGFGRLDEQTRAQSALANLLGAGRASDIGQATTQAQMSQQQQIQNAQMVQKYLGMGATLAQAQQQAAQDMERLRLNEAMQIDAIRQAEYEQRAQQNAQMLKSLFHLGQGLGGQGQVNGAGQQGGGFDQNYLSDVGSGGNDFMSFGEAGGDMSQATDVFSNISDERLKENVKDGDEKVRAFLDALQPHTYKYKDAGDGEGEQLSVMAQELEKSELGKEFVEETPRGKRVNYGKGLKTMEAASAYLEKRAKALEEKRK